MAAVALAVPVLVNQTTMVMVVRVMVVLVKAVVMTVCVTSHWSNAVSQHPSDRLTIVLVLHSAVLSPSSHLSRTVEHTISADAEPTLPT